MMIWAQCLSVHGEMAFKTYCKHPYNSTGCNGIKKNPTTTKVKTFTNYLQLKHIIHSSSHSLLFYVKDKNRFPTPSSHQGVTQIHSRPFFLNQIILYTTSFDVWSSYCSDLSPVFPEHYCLLSVIQHDYNIWSHYCATYAANEHVYMCIYIFKSTV